jgi:hypothetical protein
LLQVGSGESYGNDDAISDDAEYDEDNEEEEDDEWEDMEDWKTDTATQSNWAGISTSNRWNTHPTCPPLPKLTSNHINHRPSTPPIFLHNHNCISSYNNAYGLNGSLSESSESVPIQPPPEYQVGSSIIFIFRNN